MRETAPWALTIEQEAEGFSVLKENWIASGYRAALQSKRHQKWMDDEWAKRLREIENDGR